MHDWLDTTEERGLTAMTEYGALPVLDIVVVPALAWASLTVCVKIDFDLQCEQTRAHVLLPRQVKDAGRGKNGTARGGRLHSTLKRNRVDNAIENHCIIFGCSRNHHVGSIRGAGWA